MKRYPNGVEGQFFYEKNCPVHRPKWVQTAKVWSEGNQRIMHYCLANDLPTLVWAANLADLELHTSLSRKNNVERPTMMVFDLDPGAPAGHRAMLSGWDLAARAAGRNEIESVRKNERLQRLTSVCAAEHGSDLRPDQRFVRSLGPTSGTRTS
jgi:bifunctional non-homologous end joining protein LigD